MAKSLDHLLIIGKSCLSPQIFNVPNMSFNAFRKHKILAKISEFTVSLMLHYHNMGLDARKPVFEGVRTTQAQTKRLIRAV